MKTPNAIHITILCALFTMGCGPTIIIIDGEESLDGDEDADADSTESNTDHGPDMAACAAGTLGCGCEFDGSCDDGLTCSEAGTCYAGTPCGDAECIEGYGCTLAETCIDCAFNLGVYGCSCNISGECEGASVCENGACSEY
jgi:hypothetical protein